MRFTCALCGRGFETEDELESHDDEVHRSVPDPVAASVHPFFSEWRATCVHCRRFVGFFRVASDAKQAVVDHLRRCSA